MSLASVHGPQFADICSPLSRNNHGISASVTDLVGTNIDGHMDNVLSIEELRAQMGSCFTCGVSWVDDHVSLDCSECGGYSMQRPCPMCDGACDIIWKRDFNMSHACGKARWVGICPNSPELAATTGILLPIKDDNGNCNKVDSKKEAQNPATAQTEPKNASAKFTAPTVAALSIPTYSQLRFTRELYQRLENLTREGACKPHT